MKLVQLALICLLLPGCYTVRFRHGKLAPEAGVPREKWHHGLVNGLWELTPLKVDELCPNGVYSIENQLSAVNAISQEATRLATAPPLYVGFQANQPNQTTTIANTLGSYLIFGRKFTLWTPSTIRVVCARGPLRSVKMAVLKLAAKAGVEQGVVDLFSDALTVELRKRPGVSVMSDTDMVAILGLERQRQILGCTDSSCLAEIGGALGVDRLVTGSVGRVGGSLIVNITSLDPNKAQAVTSVSERLKSGSDEAFLDALPDIVSHLLLEPNAPPAPPGASEAPPGVPATPGR